MKKGLNTFGFTLVELMVVIAIIGILATLILVTLDNTKSTARNTRRLADIKELQLALKLYYNDNGFYPTAITAGTSISRNGVNYLLRVPENPKPWGDGACSTFNSDYQYTQLEGGKRYSLRFCLTEKTDDISAGSTVATANGILSCPIGYVGIPGSAALETNDFCVMQYEARCADVNAPTVGLTSPVNTGPNTYDNDFNAAANCDKTTNNKTVVSTPTGYPIGDVLESEAETYCQQAGGHLITNAEWTTIARDLAAVGSNWSSGTVGTGFLPLGHHALSIYNAVMFGGESYGSGGSTHIYLRKLTLTTGESIYDIAGNLEEWVSGTCAPGTGQGLWTWSGGAVEWTDSSTNDYERSVAGPSNATWNSTQRTGQYIGCSASGNGFLRGGNLSATAGGAVGLFHINLIFNPTAPSSRNTIRGFRCVK